MSALAPDAPDGASPPRARVRAGDPIRSDASIVGLPLSDVSVVLIADVPVAIPMSPVFAEDAGFVVLDVDDEALLSLGVSPIAPAAVEPSPLVSPLAEPFAVPTVAEAPAAPAVSAQAPAQVGPAAAGVADVTIRISSRQLADEGTQAMPDLGPAPAAVPVRTPVAVETTVATPRQLADKLARRAPLLAPPPVQLAEPSVVARVEESSTALDQVFPLQNVDEAFETARPFAVGAAARHDETTTVSELSWPEVERRVNDRSVTSASDRRAPEDGPELIARMVVPGLPLAGFAEVEPALDLPSPAPAHPSSPDPEGSAPDAPATEVSSVSAFDVPAFEVPEVPAFDVPVFDVPVFDVPAAPVFDVPVFDVPAAPALQVPAFDVPPAPVFDVPVFDVPAAPVLDLPAFDAPTVAAPSLPVPGPAEGVITEVISEAAPNDVPATPSGSPFATAATASAPGWPTDQATGSHAAGRDATGRDATGRDATYDATTDEATTDDAATDVVLRATNVRRHTASGFTLRVDDLAVRAGEILVVRGGERAGKSVLCRILSGFDAPDAGMLSVLDHELHHISEDERAIRSGASLAFATCTPDLVPDLTVLENTELALLVQDEDPVSARNAALGELDALGVRGLAGRRGDALARSEAVRVSLARALTGEPPFVVADDITIGLDDETVSDLLYRLLVAAFDGAAVVITTTDPRVWHALVVERGATAATLNGGRLVLDELDAPHAGGH